MKKFFFLAALATATVLSASARTTDEGAFDAFNAKAVATFNANYKGATGIWNYAQGYNEVLFFWHNELMDSYYDKDGNLIGTFHEVSSDKLPAHTTDKIASWYKGYKLTFSSVMERDDQDPVYYVTLKSADRSVILEVSNDGVMQVFKYIK